MSLIDKLRRIGVGQKSREQIERERDPVVVKMMRREQPTLEDFRISKEYRTRRARQRQQDRIKPRNDGIINVPPAYQTYPSTPPTTTVAPATSYSVFDPTYRRPGSGVGMFEGTLTAPTVTNVGGDTSVRVSPRTSYSGLLSTSPRVEPQYGGYGRGKQNYVDISEVIRDAEETYGPGVGMYMVDPSIYDGRGQTTTPYPERQDFFGALDRRFKGEDVPLPSFLDSMFYDYFPEGVTEAFTPPDRSITDPDAQLTTQEKNTLVDAYNTFMGEAMPLFNVDRGEQIREDIDVERAKANLEKADIRREMMDRIPWYMRFGRNVVTDAQVDEEYARRTQQREEDARVKEAMESYGKFPDPFGGYENYMDALPPEVETPPAIVEPAPQEVYYDAFGKVIDSPDFVVASTAQPIDRLFDTRNQGDVTEMLRLGYLSYGENAASAASKALGRDLTEIERRVAIDEGFSSVPYKDSKGNKTIGAGLTKDYFTDDPTKLGANFSRAIQDKQQTLRNKFGAAYPEDPQKEAALVSLAYRGDVYPKWTKLFKEGKTKEAQQEFWNNNEYKKLLRQENETGRESGILARIRRNEEALFGRKTVIPFIQGRTRR